jgi:hypothetical protein
MFLGFLRDNQKIPFLTLSHKLLDSDGAGKVAQSELELLEAMKNELQVHVDVASLNGDEKELSQAFKDHRERHAAMLELIGLAFVDNEFAEAEKNFLLCLSKKWAISESRFSDMVNWVRRQLDLVREAKRFLED